MKTKINFLNLLVVVSLVLAVVGLPVNVQAAATSVAPDSQETPTGLGTPIVTYAVKHDVSPALRDVEQSATVVDTYQEVPLQSLYKGDKTGALAASDKDLAVQDWNGVAAMPAPLANFDGVYNTYGVAPPDTQGDIGYDPATGKKYYVQWVNLGYAVWDVTNITSPTQVLAPRNGNTLWTGFGGQCETNNDGDPITLYDPLVNRWLMTQFAVNNPYYQCIAVSTSADPTGTYYRYAFEWKNGAGTATMNDYPKFGVWPDGYYATANQFIGNNWAGTGVAAFERSQMLTGSPARMVYFDLGVSDWGGMLPSDFDGLTAPPVNAPNYFVEVHADEWVNTPPFTQDEAAVYAFDVDWTTPASSTFTQVATLPMAPFDGDMCPWPTPGRDCVPQPGTQKLDAIADRTMYRLAYRNFGGHEALVSNLTVDVDGTDRAGIRWFEVRKTGATWSLYQEGTYAPDATHRWMGSVAQDHMGNMALGYSASSSSVFPSVRYAGRLATDPLNTLGQAEVVLHAGTASQSGVNRWGDYSMMSPDPVDDCTFWYTNEYSSGSWDWRTRIGAFKFPNCSLEPMGALQGTVSDANTAAGIVNAQVRVSRSLTSTFTTMSGPAGAYALSVPEGTYAVTASAYGYTPASISGASVLSGTTTTVNISLTTVSSYVVSGTVTDALTGWPLYARITVAGDPFNPPAPNNEVWTDPVTGYYSVTLAGNITYTLNATAWVNGYLPAAQSVAPLTSNQTVNIGLAAGLATCSAPGYSFSGGLTENFDTVTVPALPAGWAKVVVTTTSTLGSWATNAGTRYPSGQPAHSAPNLVYFNSFSAGTGGAARLYRTSGLNMTTVTTPTLSFWMYHDTGYTSSNDRVQVQVSTDGTTWTNVGAPVSRYNGTTTWTQHTIDLSAYAAQTIQVGLLGISAYGNDVHVDDVALGVQTCSPSAGGLVVGNVYDNNTAAPVVGATVKNDSGRSVTAQTTADPAVDDSFYTIFSPAGAHTFTATQVGGYVPDVNNITVVQSGTVSSNFYLGAGRLTVAPNGASATLTSGFNTVVPVTLTNSGSAPAAFELVEVNAPYVPPTFGPFADHGRHLGPKNLHLPSLAGVAYYLTPPTVPELAAGDVITSWATTGLAGPWGIGFNTLDNTLWVGNPLALTGDNLNHRFTRNGVKTGETIDTAAWVGSFAADMAYNPLTNKLWQVNAGGDNCIYELDPATRTATGQKLMPGVWYV